jgi:hypothetical protein
MARILSDVAKRPYGELIHIAGVRSFDYPHRSLLAGALVPDALWNLIEPLLPIPSSKPQGERPRPNRLAFSGSFSQA